MKRVLLVWLSLAICLLLVVGCGSREKTFSGRRALAHAKRLVAMGPRPAGSEANRQAREYIVATLERYGWEVEIQPFAYGGVSLANIIAKRGEGPIIMLGTHYDTRPIADRDPDDRSKPVPGANDGASGVAVLLELARVLGPKATQGRQVWLVFFDAEDHGDIAGWEWAAGARHFAQWLVDTPQARPECVMIVDMVGDAEQTFYYEWSSSLWLQEHLWALAKELGYAEFFVPTFKYSIIDDHTPFLKIGVEAALLIDMDYRYWHTQRDTLDKLSAKSLQRVGHVLQYWLEGEPLATRAVSR